METQAQGETGGGQRARPRAESDGGEGEEMPAGSQAEEAAARTPSRRPSVCQGRGHTSETKPDSVSGSLLRRAPQRAQPPVGGG